MSTSYPRVGLGATGLMVSPICFGTWQLSPRFWGQQSEQDIGAALRRALELGINFIDTADAYGDGLAEEVLGRTLADVARDRYVMATKVYWRGQKEWRYPDLSRDYILGACEASLRRLRISHIDLYQCHAYDPLTPMPEIVEAMQTLVRQGKIRAYGVSNWTVEQLRLGIASGGKFASCQPSYSLLNRGIENDLLPVCQAHDIGVLVYSPLHLGLLSGKYKGTETFQDVRATRADFQGERFAQICQKVAEAGKIAREHNMTTVQLVLAATLMHPGIHCAIVGIKNPAQIEDAAGAAGRSVSRTDWYKLRSLLSV